MEEVTSSIFLKRKAEKEIRRFLESKDRKSLLVDGARQVGKSYLIEKLGREYFKNFIKIDFFSDALSRNIFTTSSNTDDIISRLSLLSDKKLEKGETLFFFDEVQECKEAVTAVKYLVQEGSYKYILSGSLLGIELYSVKSMPVGYMDSIEMFPLDFEEFCMANGVQESIITSLKDSFDNRTGVDEFIHEAMLRLFRLYLVVGGMPGVVVKYLEEKNIADAVREQENIIKRYKEDIVKYESIDKKLRITKAFDAIPGELNNINKRFVLNHLDSEAKADRYENTFEWLKATGVAIPVYNAEEPVLPLRLSEKSTLFKLFLSDVGLLCSMYADSIQLRLLSGETDINYGAVYENFVSQELRAHGFERLYYFKSRKQGEVDFLISRGNTVVPLEVKSGRDYTKHHALDRILSNPKYGLQSAIVFSNANVSIDGAIIYYPIYMLMFIQREVIPPDMTYTPDISILREPHEA